MATDFETFKTCFNSRMNLDIEALDVMFVEPIKALCNWWDRQAADTKRFINFFTVGIGGGALIAFLAKVLSTTVPALATAFAEALGAVIVGIALGLVVAAFVECNIFDVPQV